MSDFFQKRKKACTNDERMQDTKPSKPQTVLRSPRKTRARVKLERAKYRAIDQTSINRLSEKQRSATRSDLFKTLEEELIEQVNDRELEELLEKERMYELAEEEREQFHKEIQEKITGHLHLGVVNTIDSDQIAEFGKDVLDMRTNRSTKTNATTRFDLYIFRPLPLRLGAKSFELPEELEFNDDEGEDQEEEDQEETGDRTITDEDDNSEETKGNELDYRTELSQTPAISPARRSPVKRLRQVLRLRREDKDKRMTRLYREYPALDMAISNIPSDLLVTRFFLAENDDRQMQYLLETKLRAENAPSFNGKEFVRDLLRYTGMETKMFTEDVNNVVDPKSGSLVYRRHIDSLTLWQIPAIEKVLKIISDVVKDDDLWLIRVFALVACDRTIFESPIDVVSEPLSQVLRRYSETSQGDNGNARDKDEDFIVTKTIRAVLPTNASRLRFLNYLEQGMVYCPSEYARKLKTNLALLFFLESRQCGENELVSANGIKIGDDKKADKLVEDADLNKGEETSNNDENASLERIPEASIRYALTDPSGCLAEFSVFLEEMVSMDYVIKYPFILEDCLRLFEFAVLNEISRQCSHEEYETRQNILKSLRSCQGHVSRLLHDNRYLDLYEIVSSCIRHLDMLTVNPEVCDFFADNSDEGSDDD